MPPRWARSGAGRRPARHTNPAATTDATTAAFGDRLARTEVILQRRRGASPGSLIFRATMAQGPRTRAQALCYCDQGTVIENFSFVRPVAVTAISFGRTTRRLNGVPSRPLNSPSETVRFSPD